jgi:hypothetical protein
VKPGDTIRVRDWHGTTRTDRFRVKRVRDGQVDAWFLERMKGGYMHPTALRTFPVDHCEVVA